MIKFPHFDWTKNSRKHEFGRVATSISWALGSVKKGVSTYSNSSEKGTLHLGCYDLISFLIDDSMRYFASKRCICGWIKCVLIFFSRTLRCAHQRSDPLHGIDIKVYSQIKFCRNSTLYPWANNLAGTLLFIAAAAGGGGGGWLYMPVCRVLARAWGTTHSTTKHVWKYSWHMCTNYLHRHAPSFESSKITIRANNKNWCYMIFGAFVVLSLLLIII